jgi:predicted amidohydrolase
MLRVYARERGVRLDIVERDYALSYLLAVARREWNQQLLPFVPNAPSVEQVLAEVRPLIIALWE